ncbi:hypothetical protein FHG87_015131 [Trinorchestia longiramus]|nr:hypothetical protein FHG87_015131 [Trinorchestia longiramus]
MDGDINDGARRASEKDERSRVNEKKNDPWRKVGGRKLNEVNVIDRYERNIVNEKMNDPLIKVGRRKMNERGVMKDEHDRKRRMQGGMRPVIRMRRDSMGKNVSRHVRMIASRR